MRIANILRFTGAVIATVLFAGTAHAQLFRAYLSPTGSDANNCTLPTPCRLLPAALAAVADGGEIWMLGSANYNTATINITKSVSILAVPGVVGSVVAVGGPAITITVGSLNIALRNLVIVPIPASGSTMGISMTGISSLTIEDSLIANLPLSGVYVQGTGTVKIMNTTVRNNGDWGVYALNGARVSIAGAKILGNGSGILADSTIATTTTVIVSDSIISGGREGAFAAADEIDGAVARVFVTRCTIEGTLTGLRSEAFGFGANSALISVSGSMITDNLYGWVLQAHGVIKSLGNNHIQDNITNINALTPASLQ